MAQIAENYFNYFTEVEECFRRVRGTPTLLSTLDWALVEAWKDAGIPLEAVCAGITRTFEKRKPKRFRKVNGLGYCTQQVMCAAEEAKTAAVEAGTSPSGQAREAPPFSPEEILKFLKQRAKIVEQASEAATAESNRIVADDLRQASDDLHALAAKGGAELQRDLEGLERSLTVIEEKLTASLVRGSSVELLTRMREEVERGMAPFRRTMTAAQIESLERQFLKKRLFERYHLPRLSLFYL